jgi:hypothetical protein
LNCEFLCLACACRLASYAQICKRFRCEADHPQALAD